MLCEVTGGLIAGLPLVVKATEGDDDAALDVDDVDFITDIDEDAGSIDVADGDSAEERVDLQDVTEMQDVTEIEPDAGSIDVADGDVADTKDVVETESEMVEAFVEMGDGEFQLRLMTGLEPEVWLLS